MELVVKRFWDLTNKTNPFKCKIHISGFLFNFDFIS